MKSDEYDAVRSDLVAPKGKSNKASEDSFDAQSNEYKLSTYLSGLLRSESNRALGDILTTIEAATPEGHQLDALKQLVKERFWLLVESNQHAVYHTFGIEPRQLRDSEYPELVRAGKDGELIDSNKQ